MEGLTTAERKMYVCGMVDMALALLAKAGIAAPEEADAVHYCDDRGLHVEYIHGYRSQYSIEGESQDVPLVTTLTLPYCSIVDEHMLLDWLESVIAGIPTAAQCEAAY